MRNRLSRGFTVLEFIVAMTLALIITALVLSVAADEALTERVSETASAVRNIQSMAQQAYSGSPGFADAAGNTPTMPSLYLLDNGAPIGVSAHPAIPTAPVATDFSNEWGGAFTVGVQSTGTAPPPVPPCTGAPVPTNDLLVITLSGIPAKACGAIAVAVAPSSYDTTVNGSLVPLVPAPTSTSQGRGSIGSLAGLCSQSSNTLIIRSLKPVSPSLMQDYPYAKPATEAQAAACSAIQYNRVYAAMQAREAAQAAL